MHVGGVCREPVKIKLGLWGKKKKKGQLECRGERESPHFQENLSPWMKVPERSGPHNTPPGNGSGGRAVWMAKQIRVAQS